MTILTPSAVARAAVSALQTTTGPEPQDAPRGPQNAISRPTYVADWPDRKKTTYHDTEQRAARTGAPLVWELDHRPPRRAK